MQLQVDSWIHCKVQGKSSSYSYNIAICNFVEWLENSAYLIAIHTIYDQYESHGQVWTLILQVINVLCQKESGHSKVDFCVHANAAQDHEFLVTPVHVHSYHY